MDGGGRIVCFGEAMIRTSRYSTDEWVETAGGAEYNVASALACLARNAVWVSALPVDAEIITAPALNCGVELRLKIKQNPVGKYTVDQQLGTVEYQRSDSAFANLESGDFDWRDELAGARWLVVSGITPLLGVGPQANWSSALTFAELDGVLVALDLNHRSILAPFEELWSIVEPRLRMVHLLVLSPENLTELTGGNSIEKLEELRKRWNIPMVACTWKIPQNGTQKRYSALAHATGISTTFENPVTHTPVDALGGGDAWLAGLIDGLLEGLDNEAACHRGDLLAALSQNTFGDLGEVTREELSHWESIEGESVVGN